MGKSIILANSLLFKGRISMDGYTDSVPVLTAERLAEIASHKWDFNVADRIRLSSQPDALAVRGLSKNGTRIGVWRREFSQIVKDFVAEALILFGGHAPYEGVYLFYDKGLLLHGDSRTNASPLTVDFFKEKYKEIPCHLVEAFADHFMTSLNGVLSRLPKGAALEKSAIFPGYDDQTDPYPNIHRDSRHSNFLYVLMHYSDPGTPYFIQSPFIRNNLRVVGIHEHVIVNGSFRTQAGDVSIHEAGVWHSRASSSPFPFVGIRPRLVQLLKVVWPSQVPA